jgi:hypothetical protein
VAHGRHLPRLGKGGGSKWLCVCMCVCDTKERRKERKLYESPCACLTSTRTLFDALCRYNEGVPGAYYLWYRRLYNACKNDSALMFAWFFLVYLFHILFCIYAAVAPSGLFGTATYSLAGREGWLVDTHISPPRHFAVTKHGSIEDLLLGKKSYDTLCA